ncbi:MAG TPA: hypothetical protein VGC87_00110 [Pyrinomonadaceae bacterium]|jgi:hypothetical protein
MGSSGSGSFSDYSKKSGSKKGGTKRRGSSKGGGGGSGASGGGGPSGGNDCAKAIGDISLEEVARCEYYQKYSDVPRVSTQVRVRKVLVGSRLGVENNKGELLGYIPTEYNYLVGCLEEGYSYTGLVKSSLNVRVPRINIDLRPHK